MNPLLYGHNNDQRIVAVHQHNDSTMRLYFREADVIRFSDDRFFPFFFIAEKRYLAGFSRKHWIKKLEGDGFYQYLCAFEEWTTLWDAIRHILDQYNRTAITKAEGYADLDILHLFSDPVTQYLLQSGRTLFKGMTFEDVHRMQLDIETYTSPRYHFSNASRAGDRIILISLSDNRGWEHLIDGKKLGERDMLIELRRIIIEKNPDVLEGHNIYNFDIPYILKRCELHNVSLAVGRDGSVPRTYDTRTSFAERAFEYTLTEIAGRHVVDTYLLVQNHDMGKRDMESYGLKYAAKYFGIAAPERTYIPGDKISWHWDHDAEPLKRYAMDDVVETRRLSEQLSGSSFYLTQLVPFGYSQVVRSGSAIKIESLMVREYLREKHSLPRPSAGVQTTGGYTDVFVVGIVGPVLHVDVESLYPSIMLRHAIAPASDVKGVFQGLLRDLTGTRLNTKRRMKGETDPQEKSRLDAMQASLKILINSFYGYLGYARGIFNDYAQADVVTKTGQDLLRQMIGYIQQRGGRVIEVDTDGVFFVPPEGVEEESDQQRFVDDLSRHMPEGITVALDGRYRKMLSYKKKNYALLGYDNRIKTKGSSLTSRSMERFGRHYILQCIECLLIKNIEGLHTLYTHLHRSIEEHKLDVKDFSRIESLKDSLERYRLDVESGKRNKSAAYEVALATGRPYRPGDRVAYYITGNDPNPRSFENCKPAEEWDPNFPDENVFFYLRRLDEFSEKFKPLFLPQDFRSVFSADDLFPFSPTGITLLTLDLPGESAGAGVDDEPPQPGIWLEE
jgi:DNA polymerase elongation subunit (family B)